MGHEAIIYGIIVGATRSPGEDYQSLFPLNEKVIRNLPIDDDHPWVDKSIFALPGDYPNGTYRRQAIHFGLTIKDDPSDLDGFMNAWIDKFEDILKQLYWFAANLHVERDFFPKAEYAWIADQDAIDGLYENPPRPVANWSRTLRFESSAEQQKTE